MSIQPLAQDLTPDPCIMLAPSQPILVTVTITATDVILSQDPVIVPWLFAGTIVFTIVSDDTFVPPSGITFLDPNAPFVVDLTDGTNCVVTAVNDNPAQTGPVLGVGAFRFNMNFIGAKGPFFHDPTVENDSPPPPPIED